MFIYIFYIYDAAGVTLNLAKEFFDILGNMIIGSLADSYMRRSIKLTKLNPFIAETILL